MDWRNKMQSKDEWDMLDSLNEATVMAGGCLWDRKRLESTTLLEQINTLAPNGVRFTYKKETQDD